MKRQTGWTVGWLCVVAAVSLLLSAVFGTGVSQKKEGTLTVAATFYPMYTAALQVVGEAVGVEVFCLTAPTTGCLHDYQLSPAELRRLCEADVVIRNGAGAEGFLEQALSLAPSLTVIDTSEGIEPLAEEDGEENEHIWLSPWRYKKQVENLRDGLCAADPEHARLYRRNAEAYLEQIVAKTGVERRAALDCAADGAVIFHESMAYVAEAWGLPVLAELPVGEDAALSAQALRRAADAVAGKTVVFLYDSQYPVPASTPEQYAGKAIRAVVNTAVKSTGEINDRDAWMTALNERITALKEGCQ